VSLTRDGFGASTIVELWNNVSIGIAYNYSAIDLQHIPVAERNGLDGSMSTLLLGSQWIAENWYLAATLSRSANLQMTNTQQYFEGTGIELYGQYQLFSNIWLLGGYNYLAPDSDQQQTDDYLLSYALFGVRYTIQDFPG
jgi:predicted porin